MLSQFRTSRVVQAVLCVAALLAVGGSFGLHPEPSATAANSPAAEFAAVQDNVAPHGCFACLTHGAAMASPLSGLVLEGAPPRGVSGPLLAFFAARSAGQDLSGRSPPAVVA